MMLMLSKILRSPHQPLLTQKLLIQPLKSSLLRLTLAAIVTLVFIQPAVAHHPFGGETPTNFWQGFLSGLGHPVIGVDHFIFVIAVGFLAATLAIGKIGIPISFILATLAGTGIHLFSIDLPIPELIISTSVLAIGVLLVLQNNLNVLAVIGFTVMAGLFHGYAYGEAIVGAEMNPLLAYLLGFACIQLLIAITAYQVGEKLLKKSDQPGLYFRFAGFTICGIGAAFLSSMLLG